MREQVGLNGQDDLNRVRLFRGRVVSVNTADFSIQAAKVEYRDAEVEAKLIVNNDPASSTFVIIPKVGSQCLLLKFNDGQYYVLQSGQIEQVMTGAADVRAAVNAAVDALVDAITDIPIPLKLSTTGTLDPVTMIWTFPGSPSGTITLKGSEKTPPLTGNSNDDRIGTIKKTFRNAINTIFNVPKET